LDALEDFACHSGRGLGRSDNPPSSFASIPARWGVSLSGHAPEPIFRDCRQCHDRQESEYSTIGPARRTGLPMRSAVSRRSHLGSEKVSCRLLGGVRRRGGG
jgi:hypothetical protein